MLGLLGTSRNWTLFLLLLLLLVVNLFSLTEPFIEGDSGGRWCFTADIACSCVLRRAEASDRLTGRPGRHSLSSRRVFVLDGIRRNRLSRKPLLHSPESLVVCVGEASER